MILEVEVTSAVAGAGWPAFVQDLIARGPTGVQLVIPEPTVV